MKNGHLPSEKIDDAAIQNIAFSSSVPNVAGTYAALQGRIAELETRIQKLEAALQEQLGLQL
jgi:uncharacterized protein YceH (UPF0502 family)